MRKVNAPIKHSGDVHPPELDDGSDEVLETVYAPETAGNATRPAIRAAKPSLMPLLGWAAAALLVYRLTR